MGKIADLKVADSAKLPWKAGNFDLVVTTDSFHHWPDPWKALLEAKRVLKKGGHLILADVWAPSPLRQLGNLLARFKQRGRRQSLFKDGVRASAGGRGIRRRQALTPQFFCNCTARKSRYFKKAESSRKEVGTGASHVRRTNFFYLEHTKPGDAVASEIPYRKSH